MIQQVEITRQNSKESKDYEFNQFLGQGNSSVYEVVDKKSYHKYALKITALDYDQIELFQKEVEIMQKLGQRGHRNIIKYYESWTEEDYDQFKNQKLKGYILMEKGITNLENYIQKRRYQSPMQELELFIKLVQQMLDGHYYMQKSGVAHRDVKPENIVLVECGDSFDFKVCDVGVGTFCDNITRTRTLIGTLSFISPELYDSYKIEHKDYTSYNPFKSDMFSLGLVFLYFGTSKKISANERNKMSIVEYFAKLDQIKEQTVKKYCQIQYLKELLELMLNRNENGRPDFIEVYEFIKQKQFFNNIFRDSSLLNSEQIIRLGQMKGVEMVKQLESYEFKEHQYIIELDIDLSKYINLSIYIACLCKVIIHSSCKLKQTNLIEQLASILKSLKNLQKLLLNLELNELAHNHVKTLFDSLSGLDQLSRLDLLLWNNNISDEGFKHLFISLLQLRNLRYLYLNVSVNRITDNAFFKLDFYLNDTKTQIDLHKLEVLVLDISLNQLTSYEKSKSIEILSRLLVQIKNLYKLDLNLEGNCIKMFGIKYLMDSMNQLSRMNDLSLNISQNDVSDNGIYSVCDYLQQLGPQQLQKLKLFVPNNQLSDKFVKQLSIGLTNIVYLEQLTLWANNNQFANKYIEMLASCLDQMVSLNYLNLNISYQQIQDLPIKHLSLALLKINSLETLKLYLDRIQITDKGSKYVSKAISVQNNLQNLVLSLNSIKTISTPSLVYVGLSLQKLKILKTFSISMQGVPLQNDGFKSISQSFLNLKQLISFSLQFTQCSIDGISAQTLVSQLKVLRKLENFYICLCQNNISERDQDIIKQQLKSHYKQNEYIVRF